MTDEVQELRIIIVGMFPFFCYGVYRFMKWIVKMDKKNGLLLKK